MRFDLVCCGSFWSSVKDVIKDYPNAKSDILDFLNYLSSTPNQGIPVPGYAGKVFKEKWALKSYKIGQSGGLRIYYYYKDNLVAPFFIYTKRQFADADKELITKLVSYIEMSLTSPAN